MTARRLAPVQEAIVSSIKSAHPGTMQKQIAAAGSVHPSAVSRWQNEDDFAEIKLSELLGMVSAFGAPAVLGPIADADACDVTPRAGLGGQEDPRVVALDVSVGATHLTRNVHAMLSDGVVTDDEAEELDREINQLVAKLHRLRARSRRPA